MSAYRDLLTEAAEGTLLNQSPELDMLRTLVDRGGIWRLSPSYPTPTRVKLQAVLDRLTASGDIVEIDSEDFGWPHPTPSGVVRVSVPWHSGTLGPLDGFFLSAVDRALLRELAPCGEVSTDDLAQHLDTHDYGEHYVARLLTLVYMGYVDYSYGGWQATDWGIIESGRLEYDGLRDPHDSVIDLVSRTDTGSVRAMQNLRQDLAVVGTYGLHETYAALHLLYKRKHLTCTYDLALGAYAWPSSGSESAADGWDEGIDWSEIS